MFGQKVWWTQPAKTA